MTLKEKIIEEFRNKNIDLYAVWHPMHQRIFIQTLTPKERGQFEKTVNEMIDDGYLIISGFESDGTLLKPTQKLIDEME